MKEQISCLRRLQEIDIEIEKVNSKLTELGEKVVEINNSVDELNSNLQNTTEKLESNKSIIEEKRKIVISDNEKLTEMRGKLSTIKTNREYQAALKEIDVLKRKNLEIEKEIEVLEEENVKLEGDLPGLQSECSEKVQELSSAKDEFEKEMNGLENKKGEMNDGREKVKSKVQRNYYETYQLVKERRNGIAVVLVSNGTCNGCFMSIPPQLFNRVIRGEEFLSCPHCNRILFWEE